MKDYGTGARMAADYCRELGYNKAADYVERHYDGPEEFDRDKPIPVRTRNCKLEGTEAPNGVPFVRRTADLGNLKLEGVYPDFEQLALVELGDEVRGMNLHQQFSRCKEELQSQMFDHKDSALLEKFTLGQCEKMDTPNGYSPEGTTWNHEPDLGKFKLVATEDHEGARHDGGRVLYGEEYDTSNTEKTKLQPTLPDTSEGTLRDMPEDA